MSGIGDPCPKDKEFERCPFTMTIPAEAASSRAGAGSAKRTNRQARLEHAVLGLNGLSLPKTKSDSIDGEVRPGRR